METQPYTIKSIHLYPIKGMGGISLEKSMAMTEGIEWDRHWMLINPEGKFLTQREHREFVQFKTELEKEGIRVHFKGESIFLPFKMKSESLCPVVIWEHELLADVCEDKYHKWFSKRLGTDVRLVSLSKEHARIKKLRVAPDETPIRFSDGYPYTILGTASLALLNEKLEDKLDAERFRSTILVETTKAHEEDEWVNFSIGTSNFKMVKPCSRCVVTTINQTTGASSKEPLRTLNSYRKEGNYVNFSMNAICLEEGIISVGDQIHF